MLKYFRKNDPHRIIALVLLLIATRATYFCYGVSIFDGVENHTLHFGPLYNLVSHIPGINEPSILGIFIAALLVLFNAVFLNTLFIRNASFQESSYIPAVIYIVLMSASPDFYVLSPVLLGNIFILISLSYLFNHLRFRGSEENILSTGFSLGLACLCYPPYFWIYLFLLIIYLLYSQAILHRYFLMTWGLMLPILLTWLLFFLLDQGQLFLKNFLLQTLTVQGLTTIPNNALKFLLPATVPGVIAFIQQFLDGNMTNHQILIKNCMRWIAVFGILIFVVFGRENMGTLSLLICAISYFTTSFLISVRKKSLGEIVLLIMLLSAIATSLSLY